MNNLLLIISSHTVTLVPIGVDAPNVGEVQKRLNSIYAPYGVEFTVKVDDAIKELEGWKGRAFKLEGNGFFTRENADMAEIRKAYQNASSVDKDEYYIFVLGGADAGSEDSETQAYGAQGDMPRGTQFGYIFGDRATDLGWLLAHELGHGVFTLKHLNEANYAGKSSLGTLPNLMDYTGSTALAAFQWNGMSNPAILTGLDSDDASKAETKIVRIYKAPSLDEERYKLLSDFSKQIIKEAAEKSENYTIQINSTIRYPAKQAEEMYNNLSKGKRIRYAPTGMEVTKLYDECVKQNLSRVETISKMTTKIEELSKQNKRVSLHCVSVETYSQCNVVDISLGNITYKTEFIMELIKNKNINKIIHPINEITATDTRIRFDSNEPCIHIEITQ